MLLCPKAGIMVCSLFHLICRVLPQLLSLTWSFSTSVKEAFIAVNYHQPAKPFFLNDQNSHSAYTYQDFIRCHLDSGITKGLVSLFKFGCRCLPSNDHWELQKRHSKVTKLHNKIQELEENEYQSSFLSHKPPLALSSPSSSLNECYSDSRNNSSSATLEAPRASLPSTAALLRIKLQYLSNLMIPATWVRCRTHGKEAMSVRRSQQRA